ncbi:MAG: aldo/keto reductase [Nitrospirae bacterium]|nr:aldo/keto reductase [Nitrospirota bacterium]
MRDIQRNELGRTGIKVFPLGLSATYRPGKDTVFKALDEGVNLFFCFGFDSHMIKVLRGLSHDHRHDVVIATGAYNLLWGHPNLRRTLEKRLRQLRTDYIDLFLFLGVTKPKHLTDDVREEMARFREEGKVRAIGISTHNRPFAGQLCANGALDVIMMRYNAAHRGAEEDIFPHLGVHDPGVVGYTATRWRYLMRRPTAWPSEGRIPTAGECYRFVLSNPNVDVCLTAPRNRKELGENLAAVRRGPLTDDDLGFMRQFGDAVHHTKKWFM